MSVRVVVTSKGPEGCRAGRVLLRLDDGAATELRPGDCVVQRGAMHAWENPFAEPCTLTGVMLATA
jgi:hypothetical protein